MQTSKIITISAYIIYKFYEVFRIEENRWRITPWDHLGRIHYFHNHHRRYDLRLDLDYDDPYQSHYHSHWSCNAGHDDLRDGIDVGDGEDDEIQMIYGEMNDI